MKTLRSPLDTPQSNLFTLNFKLFTLLFTFLLAPNFAQDKVGTTAAPFLTIPGGARPTAMGGAYVAVAEGPSAQFWNPAGIALTTTYELEFSMADWFLDTKLSHAAVVIPIGRQVIGLNMKQLDYGDEMVTTIQDPEGTGEYWSARDRSLGVNYAVKLTDRFTIGGTAKFITQKIYHESDNAVALDLGLLYRSQFKNLRIGMSIANFGSDMQLTGEDLMRPVDIDPSNEGNNDNISSNLNTDKWPLPLTYCVGIAADIVEREYLKWTLTADALHPNNNNSFMRIGTEVVVAGIIYLRTGHSSIMKKHAEESFSYGIGFRYNLGGLKFGYDYSYTPFGKLGNVPRNSIYIGL
ncbi:MAG: PorV/PorQ family protein [Candidatus Marinimicrobia bacterium]|nr:PorV/PorQ family protein [Candidatus Neomarinimicrobiota bacterium]